MATNPGVSTAKSIGLHGHWGFSAAFDFLELLSSVNAGQPLPDVINILLVNPGDIRHILCTLSRLFRNRGATTPSPSVHFYLLENPIEVLARDLVLLELFCDLELPVRQRATVFLEAYGNMKVQRRTNAYLDQLSSRLRNLMAKSEGTLQDVLDFSHLGFRERDLLENAFKNYQKGIVMDMNSWFDHRKRGLYEERYDSRKALFDWDYHGTLKSRASIIHIKQFKTWRDSGIAFEFGDQEYVETNKSMMTYTEGFLKNGKDRGLKKEVMGYWGDIVCSPYFAFGIDCDTPNKQAEGLFEIYNKGTGTEQHRHHAVEIALYNLFSYMWEMENGTTYKMVRINDVYSGLGKATTATETTTSNDPNEVVLDTETEDEGVSEKTDGKSKLPAIEEGDDTGEEEKGEEQLDGGSDISPPLSKAEEAKEATIDESEELEANVAHAMETAEHVYQHLDHIKVFPLTGSFSQTLAKQKYRHFFHGAFVSSRFAQVIDDALLQELMYTENAIKPVVAVETAKFLVSINTDVKRDFLAKIEEYAGKKQWQKLSEPPVFRRHRDEDDKEDDVVFFRV